MLTYTVSVPSKRVIVAYAKWKSLSQAPERTIMHDGWTLPALRFERLYEAHVACLDLAMVSGSLKPFRPHGVLVTEVSGATPGIDPARTSG